MGLSGAVLGCNPGCLVLLWAVWGWSCAFLRCLVPFWAVWCRSCLSGVVLGCQILSEAIWGDKFANQTSYLYEALWRAPRTRIFTQKESADVHHKSGDPIFYYKIQPLRFKNTCFLRQKNRAHLTINPATPFFITKFGSEFSRLSKNKYFYD